MSSERTPKFFMIAQVSSFRVMLKSAAVEDICELGKKCSALNTEASAGIQVVVSLAFNAVSLRAGSA